MANDFTAGLVTFPVIPDLVSALLCLQFGGTGGSFLETYFSFQIEVRNMDTSIAYTRWRGYLECRVFCFYFIPQVLCNPWHKTCATYFFFRSVHASKWEVVNITDYALVLRWKFQGGWYTGIHPKRCQTRTRTFSSDTTLLFFFSFFNFAGLCYVIKRTLSFYVD